MAIQRHLNNAPIVEAVIDIRVNLKSAFKEDEISSLKNVLGEQYPTSETIKIFEGGFGLVKGEPWVDTLKDKGIDGFRFKSKDEKNIVQFKNDGFTFNRLKPYTSWNNVIVDAKSLWGIYFSNFSVERVTRIAVRYINQLDIPLPIKDFKDFLTRPPDVPDDVPDAISSFLCRIVLHDVERSISANVAQALEKSIKPDFANIILDIDVYKNVDMQSDNYEQIWVILEQLHKLKNKIFFNSITESTARLFE
jgi:uncharacterized protein (TIGR04255 family)